MVVVPGLAPALIIRHYQDDIRTRSVIGQCGMCRDQKGNCDVCPAIRSMIFVLSRSLVLRNGLAE